MNKKHPLGLMVVAIAALGVFAGLAGQDSSADPGRLTLDRLFASREVAPERFGPARWISDGSSYTTLAPSAEAKGGRDLVLYKAESGERRVLVPASKLVPPGSEGPLAIENYAWSPDGKILIVFTNSQRVWRQNTRGDFWTYELASGRLRQLGTGFEPSSLMFAKLSPDGRKAAPRRNSSVCRRRKRLLSPAEIFATPTLGVSAARTRVVDDATSKATSKPAGASPPKPRWR
jgi:dipeptidyl-peptidase-4